MMSSENALVEPSQIIGNSSSFQSSSQPMSSEILHSETNKDLPTIAVNKESEHESPEVQDSRPQRKVSKRKYVDITEHAESDSGEDDDFRPGDEDSEHEDENVLIGPDDDWDRPESSNTTNKKRKKASSEIPDDMAERIQLSLPALSVRIRESLKRSSTPEGIMGVPKQVPADVRLTATGKQSHARKQVPGYVKRPRNPFILFRSHICVNNIIPDELGITDHRHVSRIVGLLWKNLPPEDKSIWEAMANTERAEHKKLHPNYIYRPSYRKSGAVRRRRRKETDEQHLMEEQRRCSVVARVIYEGGDVSGQQLENAIKEQEEADRLEDERRAILGLEPANRASRRPPRSRSVSTAHRSVSQRKVSEPMADIEEAYRQQRAHTVPVPAPLHIDQSNPYIRGVNPNVPTTAELFNMNFPLQTPQGMYMDQYINVNGDQAAAQDGGQQYDPNASTSNWNGFNELDVNRTFMDQNRFMGEGHGLPANGIMPSGSHGYNTMMPPVDENGLQPLSQDGSIHALAPGVEHMSPNGKQAYNYQLQALQPHHPMSNPNQSNQTDSQYPIDLSQLRVEVYNNVKYVQLPREKASDAKLVESLRQAGLGISFEATEGEIRAMMSH